MDYAQSYYRAKDCRLGGKPLSEYYRFLKCITMGNNPAMLRSSFLGRCKYILAETTVTES